VKQLPLAPIKYADRASRVLQVAGSWEVFADGEKRIAARFYPEL